MARTTQLVLVLLALATAQADLGYFGLPMMPTPDTSLLGKTGDVVEILIIDSHMPHDHEAASANKEPNWVRSCYIASLRGFDFQRM